MERLERSGFERLARGDDRSQRRHRSRIAPAGDTRYSVGAMQSTPTRSRSTISRRSAGSKRPSCSSAGAPRSHGAMNTLRADLLQPLAAVHQASSPELAPSQCSACSVWPER